MPTENILIAEELTLLGEKEVFVGRKKDIFERFGKKAGMYVGIVAEGEKEEKSYFGREILVDSISPHAIFVCGMRGSGKSYTIGVFAEELALKNEAVGVVIIDPMGIFWSMKRKNEVDTEKSQLKKWNLHPEGIINIRTFIPKGFTKDAPRETWDAVFSIRPSELTVEDWCNTFGFDRFDVMGLLIDKVMEDTKNGFQAQGKLVEGKEEYSIQDLLLCIENDEAVISKEKGFKESTCRALSARLRGASDWGIFDAKGTELKDISCRDQISVLDVSFLDDNVRALVVGIFARKVLQTRKLASRQEAAGFHDAENVPVTWLMIDEAHILVPAGRKTAASNALLEYVRQGRQPGCSIVLATQQPSAIDSRILSQMDILFCHKLVFEDDIKAVMRRMPCQMPEKFKDENFIKHLPVGMVIIGDKQEETSRAFLARMRPRISQHEGRERLPIFESDPTKARGKSPEMQKEDVAITPQAPEQILQREKKASMSGTQEKFVSVEILKGERVFDEEELKDLKTREARVVHGNDKKIRLFGEGLRGLFSRKIHAKYKVYYPLWQVFFDYYPSSGDYENLSCFLDGITGEVLLAGGERSRGIRDLIPLKNDERKVMLYLFRKRHATQLDLIRETGFTKGRVKSTIQSLGARGLVKLKVARNYEEIRPRIAHRIITTPKDKSLRTLAFQIEEDIIDEDLVVEAVFRQDNVQKALDIWDVMVYKSQLVYYPYWIVVYEKSFDILDGVTGKKCEYVKSMLRFRV